MTVKLTTSDFKAHINTYLDKVNDDETVYITLPNGRSVAVVSQKKLDLLERALWSKEDSLDFAITHDQLIEKKVLPDDNIIKNDDRYWNQFKR